MINVYRSLYLKESKCPACFFVFKRDPFIKKRKKIHSLHCILKCCSFSVCVQYLFFMLLLLYSWLCQCSDCHTNTTTTTHVVTQTTHDVIFTNSVSNFCCHNSSYCCYYRSAQKPPEQKIPFKYYYIPHERWIPCIIFLPRRLYLKRRSPKNHHFYHKHKEGKNKTKQKTKSSLWFFIIIVSPWSEGILQRNYTKMQNFNVSYFI